MSVRMIATDLDGTLLGEDKNISPINREALRACYRKGVEIAFASGRSFHSARLLAKKLDVPVRLLCLNGCMAAESAEGPVLFDTRLPREAALSLWDRLQATGAYFICYAGDKVYMGNRQPYSGHDTKPGRRGEPGYYQEYTDDEADFRAEGCARASKFVLFSLDAACRDRARRAVDGLGVNVFSSWWDNVEIVPGGVSKGAGLARLAERYGISMADVMAFGDYDNDETMLSAVGHPVAMASGSEALKKPGRPQAAGVGEYILSLMEAGKL